ncbi:hypothetical protein DH09_12815 [Bacillaceae bacterium JMAK1]|nr:hypothetical protein DH09_12815 [Bacillaceae bacterium JMAK1]
MKNMRIKILITVLICAILIVVFWRLNVEPELSEEEALSSVIDKNSNENEEIDILSIKKRWGNYIVEWEKVEHCEEGTNTVDGVTAEITKGEVSIC